MNELPESDSLITEFRNERSIRRTVRLLQAKRSRIREDLTQLIAHLSMLVPLSHSANDAADLRGDLLIEALSRIDDDAFAQLLLQLLQEINL